MKIILEQIKRYFKTIRPMKKYYIPMFLLSFFLGLMGAFLSWLMALIISNITSGHFNIVIFLLISTFLLQLIFRILCSFHAYFYTLNKNYNIRTIVDKVLKKLTAVDENYYEKYSKGQTINLLINESENIAIFTNEITHIIAQISQSIILIIILFNINLAIGAISLIASILCVLVKNYYINKESYYAKKIIQKKDDMISELGEMITANYEVKSMNIFSQINNLFYTRNEEKIKLSNTSTIYHTLRNQLTPVLETIFQYSIMIILIVMIYKQNATIDIYVIVIGYYASLVTAFNQCMNFVSILRNNDISISRLIDFLNFSENASEKFGQEEIIMIDKLALKSVSFHYDNRNRNLLKNVDCEFHKGTLTVLTGSNGNGKTTLFKLILGILKPKKGTIYLNEKDIYKFDYQSYISQISLVNQKPYFFKKSILENLKYVCNREDKIIEVCKQVGIHDFIMNLPEQYDTILNEDAVNISGGEKQKLALVRALLKDSPILLLDEFSSSIDQESLLNIYCLLQELKKDKIIIMITHKQIEMDRADAIYELWQGSTVRK